MKKYNVEYRRLTNDDFSRNPACFNEDVPHATCRLIRHDNCGMILRGYDNPHYYFHNMDMETSRWAGIIRLGDGPLGLQTGVHDEDMVQFEPLTPYGVIRKNPLTYGVMTTRGIEMEFQYNEAGCTIREGKNGSILDVKGEWFPYGVICHIGSEYNIPFIHLPVLLEGTYQGEKVKFLACIDRIFSPEGLEEDIIRNATEYISSYCSGVREDGRREFFMALITHDNGKGLGIYWLEGEDPIITDEVVNEGEWIKLPYVDDGTVVNPNQVWRFGGKEFHVIGKWGAKGFTAKPRMERHGQSQYFGTWYEGNTPYQHEVWNTFNENMGAFSASMKERGFDVQD